MGSELFSDKTAEFVEQVHLGLDPTTAARAAGYASPQDSGKELMAHPMVRRMLATLARVNSKKGTLATREQVHEMVMEAFEIAKIQADAGSMVRAASELNRMNGFYEPEKRELTVTMSLQQKKQALTELSDEELLKLMEQSPGELDVVEGEFEVIDGSAAEN